MALAECLNQLDLERQVLRVIRRDAVQFIEQLRTIVYWQGAEDLGDELAKIIGAVDFDKNRMA